MYVDVIIRGRGEDCTHHVCGYGCAILCAAVSWSGERDNYGTRRADRALVDVGHRGGVSAAGGQSVADLSLLAIEGQLGRPDALFSARTRRFSRAGQLVDMSVVAAATGTARIAATTLGRR